MKSFVDTSVLVAACWAEHPGHEPSLKLVAGATRESWACGVHTLAEMFATLTALPLRPAITTQQAMMLVEDVERRLTAMVLDPDEHLSTIRDVSVRGGRSGLVYDGLLLQCARKYGARWIYTWNQKYFERIAPDLASRMRTP